jgi:hypothetical protein
MADQINGRTNEIEHLCQFKTATENNLKYQPEEVIFPLNNKQLKKILYFATRSSDHVIFRFENKNKTHLVSGLSNHLRCLKYQAHDFAKTSASSRLARYKTCTFRKIRKSE